MANSLFCELAIFYLGQSFFPSSYQNNKLISRLSDIILNIFSGEFSKPTIFNLKGLLLELMYPSYQLLSFIL